MMSQSLNRAETSWTVSNQDSRRDKFNFVRPHQNNQEDNNWAAIDQLCDRNSDSKRLMDIKNQLSWTQALGIPAALVRSMSRSQADTARTQVITNAAREPGTHHVRVPSGERARTCRPETDLLHPAGTGLIKASQALDLGLHTLDRLNKEMPEKSKTTALSCDEEIRSICPCPPEPRRPFRADSQRIMETMKMV